MENIAAGTKMRQKCPWGQKAQSEGQELTRVPLLSQLHLSNPYIVALGHQCQARGHSQGSQSNWTTWLPDRERSRQRTGCAKRRSAMQRTRPEKDGKVGGGWPVRAAGKTWGCHQEQIMLQPVESKEKLVFPSGWPEKSLQIWAGDSPGHLRCVEGWAPLGVTRRTGKGEGQSGGVLRGGGNDWVDVGLRGRGAACSGNLMIFIMNREGPEFCQWTRQAWSSLCSLGLRCDFSPAAHGLTAGDETRNWVPTGTA